MTHKSPESRLRIAVFAGTFNPFTIGHADIVERGLRIFDSIVICLGVNSSKEDDHQAAERAARIAELYASEPRVTVECWRGLTADFARAHGAEFLLRGVRSDKDCDYERNLADANSKIFGLETVILFSKPDLAYVSSSLVRELRHYGIDTDGLVP